MQPGVADVIAVAKAAAQLRTAVVRTGVVIGTLHHIHTPDAVTSLQFFWGKARRRAENTSRGFDENAGNKAVKPRYVQQGETTKEYTFESCGEKLDMAELQEIWESKLEPVYPYRKASRKVFR